MPLKENLCRDKIASLGRKEALTVSPSTSVAEAVAMMQSHRAGCLFVTEGERLAGIFTERDLLKRVLGRKQPFSAMIQSVMTPSPAAVQDDEPIESALRKMCEGGYRHLPLVDKRGRAAGRVSVREIVHYMVEHFPNAVYNLPPSPDQVPTAPDGA